MKRPFSPSAERNKEAILDVLRRILPNGASVLEIGSGTGQHARYFCEKLAGIAWQPSEQRGVLDTLILGLQASAGTINTPVIIDVTEPHWPVGNFDAIFTANTMHIMSWLGVSAFFSGAGRHLRARGYAVIYGPFKYQGHHTADSNRSFDIDLQRKAPQMGIRDVADLSVLAKMSGLTLTDDVEMPVNNRILVFQKSEKPGI